MHRNVMGYRYRSYSNDLLRAKINNSAPRISEGALTGTALRAETGGDAAAGDGGARSEQPRSRAAGARAPPGQRAAIARPPRAPTRPSGTEPSVPAASRTNPRFGQTEPTPSNTASVYSPLSLAAASASALHRSSEAGPALPKQRRRC